MSWRGGVLATLCLLAPLAAAPRPAEAAAAVGGGPTRVDLDLPLYDPAAGWSDVPAYQARKFEVRLSPAARPIDPGTVRAQARVGAPGVDRLLARFAVSALEPEFPGAVPPEAGSAGADLSSYYIVHLPPGAALAEALAAFRAEPDVVSADPIGVFPVASVPNDSLFSQQYAFSQPSDRDSDLPEAWDVTQGDTSVVVAIIDTGVLWTHPDLGGPPPYTGGNVWCNWAEMAGTPGVDDDGNGYVDDLRGWDFVTGVTGPAAEDLSTPDGDPSDYVGHGTFVAGVAGAIVNNLSGVAGAGYRVKILGLRAGWDDGVHGGGVVDMSFCAQAIYYAANQGAAAINCSWTNGDEGGLAAAVSYALAHGSTVVVAAGNQSTSSLQNNYLASRGDCVDVAALDASDALAWFSNFGPWVDVCAGGDPIRSTSSSHYTPGYGVNIGTSFAAPLVAGIVGLYQSWRKQHGLAPATPADVLSRLRDTADPVDALNPGYEGKMGGGRVNAARMILDPPTSFATAIGGAVSGAAAFVDWGGGAQTIVFGTDARKIWAVDGGTGAARPGWPVSVGGAVRTNPAVWDVDFDGAAELIAGADDGRVYALRADGGAVPGWPVTVGGTIDAGPALGDVAGDPAYEIVVGTSAPNALHVIGRSGTEAAGWPRSLPAAIYSSPAIADLDGAGYADIVFGADDSTVYALRGDGSALPGWPIKLGGAVWSSPVIGDLDGDGGLDVVAASNDGVVHAWSAGGTTLAGWPVSVGSDLEGGPALADVDGDARPEVVAGSEAGSIYAWKRDGTLLAGWPASAGGAVRGCPVVADVDRDGTAEVIAGSLDGSVYAFRADGTPLPGWPRATGAGVSAAGSLGDPDRDGRLELAIGSADQKLYCWDFGSGTYDPSRLPWPTARGSFLRQGTTRVPAIDVEPPSPPSGLRLAVSPNPGRGSGEARLVVPGQAGQEVRFSLYDARGRLLRAEQKTFDERGAAVWALDAGGARWAGAGLYFVLAQSRGQTASAKWIVLR